MTESNNNPTPEEVVKIALSGAAGGEVKTLADIRMEKLEARFDALEKENAELRKANAELYAFAQAQVQAKPAAAVQPVQPTPAQVPVSAAPVKDPAVIQEQAKREESILDQALSQLGYVKKKQETVKAPEDSSGM